MATQVQRRRGTTTEHSTFTGAEGELTVDTTKDTVVVHDGATAGGQPLAREDLDNVSSADVTAKVSAGTTSAAGKVQLEDSTTSTSTTTAATPNSVKVAKDAADAAQSTADAALPATGGTISSNLTVEGNLTVNGTTTTVDSETLLVKDKNIEMGVVGTPTDTTANGGGITLKGTTDKTINWVDSTDSWTSSENVDLASGKTYKIAGTDVLSATTLGSGVTGSSLTSVGNLTDLTVDTDTLYVDATNDRVGIGTASPFYELDVEGASDPSIRVRSTGTAASDDSLLRLQIGGTTASNFIFFGDSDSSTAGQIRYNHNSDALTFNTNGTLRMTLDSSGRVMLGASVFTGATRFAIRGNTSSSTGSGNIYLVRGESSADMADNDLVGMIRFSDEDDNRSAEIRSTIDGTPSATATPGELSFWTTAAGAVASTQRMTIDSSGNVGINQTSPAQLLDVNGDALINNLTIGKGAGSLDGNTAIGDDVLGNATTGGESNTGVGYIALQDLTTGANNTAVGRSAGLNITTGDNNTFVGRSSGFNTTTGNNNTVLGEAALFYNVAGNAGTAIGRRSQLYANDNATGFTNSNVSVGYESLRGGSTTPADNTGSANTAIGYQAGLSTTSGSHCTALGYRAAFDNQTGDYVTAIGSLAAYENIALTTLTAIGYQSQRYANNTTTPTNTYNTSVGHDALRFSTTPADNTGTHNTAMGHTSLQEISSGSYNVGFGNYTLSDVSTGNRNTACGYAAGSNLTTGEDNTAIGQLALQTAVTLSNCTAIGYEAQRYADNTTTAKNGNNVSVGFRALRGSTTAADNTGANNTAVGHVAMQLNTSGSSNAAFGHAALYNNTTGNSNSALGYDAGRYDTSAGNANFTNCTYLGHDTRASGDNQVQLGDSSTTTYAYGSVQDRSDERDKADIRDTVIGLDFINTLRPVDFRWDMRDDYFDTEIYEEEETETVEVPNPAYVEDGDEPRYIEETVTKMVTKDRLVPVPKDGSRKRNRFHHGLIAQEVKAAADAAGVDFAGYQDHSVGGGKDVLTLGYSELIAPLIKAVQELSAENAALKARLDALEGV